MVVLTGKDDEELALRALQEGAKDYLVKGQADADQLSRAIRYAVERGRTEESLRQSEELFRGAFENTKVAMALADMGNRFLRVNEAFSQMFGFTEEELLRLSVADITHPDDLAESYARRERLLAGEGQFFQMEKRYLHKDGHILWGLTNVSLVAGAVGRADLLCRPGAGRDPAEIGRGVTEEAGGANPPPARLDRRGDLRDRHAGQLHVLQPGLRRHSWCNPMAGSRGVGPTGR